MIRWQNWQVVIPDSAKDFMFCAANSCTGTIVRGEVKSGYSGKRLKGDTVRTRQTVKKPRMLAQRDEASVEKGWSERAQCHRRCWVYTLVICVYTEKGMSRYAALVNSRQDYLVEKQSFSSSVFDIGFYVCCPFPPFAQRRFPDVPCTTPWSPVSHTAS